MVERIKPVAPATGTDTVTVACKLPHGLVLRVFQREEVMLPAGATMIKSEMWAALPESYTVKGNAHPQNEAPRCLIVDGYAMTPGIPREHWELWLHQNRKHPAVMNGLIFAHGKQADVRAEAHEKKDTKSGLERIDPNNLAKLGGEFKKVVTSEDQVAEFGYIDV